MAHHLEPPTDRHSVFLMGSEMAATTAILVVTYLCLFFYGSLEGFLDGLLGTLDGIILGISEGSVLGDELGNMEGFSDEVVGDAVAVGEELGVWDPNPQILP